ncbi:Autophagy protein 22 [Kappamyces sp. JEL0680]|nr:Autophagy protein 22 [Kappamyces sp. JEL0680]
MLTNTLAGALWVFIYAWVPILTRFNPAVIEARANPALSIQEVSAVSEDVANDLSTKGFMYSYASSVSQLIIGCAFVILFTNQQWGLTTTYPMQIAIAATCVFQIVILTVYTAPRLKERPGPPLPAGTKGYVSYSLSSLWSTLKEASRLTELFKFLLGWFIYSDAFTTVVSISLLFAQSSLGAGTIILLSGAIIVPLIAGIGAWIWNKLQMRMGWSNKKTLLIQTVMYLVLPLWGLLGFFTPRGSIGLQNQYELLVLGAYHGFLLGATQSTCRVYFSGKPDDSLTAELIPHGHEAQFFGLYEITDKGSAWIGPLVVAGITSATGNMRFSFIFLAVLFLVSIACFATLDVDKGRLQAKDFLAKDALNISLVEGGSKEEA